MADGPLPLPSAQPTDARQIGGLRWEAHPGCERFVIDLHTGDGAAAHRAGAVTAEVLRSLGVVRVTLPTVTEAQANATEASFDGDLARAAYSVTAPDREGTFVDLHLDSASEAHVFTLEQPARVVVDLRPGGPPVPGPAATARRVVVLQPRPGAASYPITLTGYARTFEANVVARLEQDGRDVFETFTTATGWLEAWGHYSIVIQEGPGGRVQLHVGEYSARDGTWEGTVVQLDMNATR